MHRWCVPLREEDRLVLFTDGITEAADSHDQEYGDAAIESIATEAANDSSTSLIAKTMADVDRFCQSQFQDDATMLVITGMTARTDSVTAGENSVASVNA
ncbi:MAG: SpoIIE family protein phosphatase [Terriglobales bacterium]